MCLQCDGRLYSACIIYENMIHNSPHKGIGVRDLYRDCYRELYDIYLWTISGKSGSILIDILISYGF